jgi:hypothetical protein
MPWAMGQLGERPQIEHRRPRRRVWIGLTFET